MTEPFTIHFLYGGVQQEVNCHLRAGAYNYQFICQLENREIILEKDEEGQWRVREADPFGSKNKQPDRALIGALIEQMERILHELI